MEKHILHTRLIALLAGVAIAAAIIGVVYCVLPAQETADASRNYGYVYSGTKSESTAFAKATAGENRLLLFGSSELSTPESLVPEVPSAVFGAADYGLQLGYVGEAYDQSLWHAIALGAYAGQDAVGKKVGLIVSPGWFVDGGMDPSTFQTRFSFSLYADFCSNHAVSDASRAYVRQRLATLGVDEATLAAANGDNPLAVVNGTALRVLDDLKLRRDLRTVRAGGMAYPSAQTPPLIPDFAALRQTGASDGAARSTTNDWGVEDAFWTEQLEPALDSVEGYRAAETYSKTPEYDDLACLLRICRECGIEPLVIISPVMGPYYDYIGISAATRSACYDHIRAVCADAGCAVADFSDREYEKYFLYDIVHFGWTGWADVEQALYEFAKGE